MHKHQAQMQRAHKAVPGGHLTKQDAQKLRECQKEVRELRRQANADGVVTDEERAAIRQKVEEKDKIMQSYDGLNRGQRKKMPDVQAQLKLQNRSIVEGLKSGQLTPEEAKALRNGQKEIRDLVKAARADGIITDEEKALLGQKLEQQDKLITQEKTDADIRTPDKKTGTTTTTGDADEAAQTAGGTTTTEAGK
jgi:uncharacterized membrane protein YebE (DUF533 family)